MNPGKFFCIAPFTQVTFGPTGNYSPCPEIGGRPWKEKTIDLIRMWNSDEFDDLRNSFASNQKHQVCNRCWEQEDYGNQSLRKRLLSSPTKKFAPGELMPFLKSGYQEGPTQINIMVGNTCNLRCRVCCVASSSTYAVEGKYYKDQYNLPNNRYTANRKKPIKFSSQQIDQMFNLGKNLQRIEFYGGEPLLDIPTLTLLQKLVDSGQSKNITLFYNTNGTVAPTETHYQLWSQFQALEFNFSVDDIEARFTYARHPGIWQDWLTNVTDIRTRPWTIPVKFNAICTVSNLNIFYLPELLNTLDQIDLSYFLNTLHGPAYYDITHLPVVIKAAVIEKLKTYQHISKIQFLINMLGSVENLQHWEDFKFWTRAKDEYRNEIFGQTFPEFYTLCRQFDPDF